MSFVEFNETTGEIISVGNMFEKDKLCIPIDPKIAKALISGTEQSINWRVVPDKKESQKYKIIKIEKNVNEEFISTSIFPIERLPAHHKEKNIFQRDLDIHLIVFHLNFYDIFLKNKKRHL